MMKLVEPSQPFSETVFEPMTLAANFVAHRAAPPPAIAYPDPQALNRARELRRRVDERAEAARLNALYERTREAGVAFANGVAHGKKAGYMRGVQWGMYCGFTLGVTGLVAVLLIGRWAGVVPVL